MNEYIKRSVALVVLLGNVSMMLPAVEFDSAVFDSNYERINEDYVINKKDNDYGLDLSDYGKLSFETIDELNKMTDENVFLSSVYLIEKSQLFKELQKLKDKIKKEGLDKVTKEQLKKTWEESVETLISNIVDKNNFTSKTLIKDFISMEKELYNSLLNEYLYDQNSLRKESDENLALAIVNELCDKAENEINTNLEQLFNDGKIEFSTVNEDSIAVETETWLDGLNARIESGLEVWDNAEKEFLIKKESWKQQADLKFVEDVESWNNAYQSLLDRKSQWKQKVQDKLLEGELYWLDKESELSKQIEESRKNLDDKINAEYNQKFAVIDAQYTMLEQSNQLIITTDQGIDVWINNWSVEFPEFEELSEKKDYEKLIEIITQKKEEVCENQTFCDALITLENLINENIKYRLLKEECIEKISNEYLRKDQLKYGTIEHDQEIEKIESLEEYWQEQVKITEALYEYSQNRTASAENKDETIDKYNFAKNEYERQLNVSYEEQEKLNEIENKYKSLQNDFEEQKKIVNQKLQNYESIQQQMNNLKYEISLSEISILKKELTESINSLNRCVKPDDFEGKLFSYFEELALNDYEQIVKNANSLIERFNEHQIIEDGDIREEVLSNDELIRIINSKNENSENAKRNLEYRYAVAEYIRTGTITQSKYETEICVEQLEEDLSDLCIEKRKEKDKKILQSISETISEYKESGYPAESYDEFCNKLTLLLDENCPSYITSFVDIYKLQIFNSQNNAEVSELVNEINSVMDKKIKIKSLEYGIENCENIIESLISSLTTEKTEIVTEADDKTEKAENKSVSISDLLYYQERYETFMKKVQLGLSYIYEAKEKYSDYETNLETVTTLLEQAKKEYESELEKITINGKDNLYSKLDKVFNEYNKKKKDVDKANDNVQNALLELKICEQIKNWAENEYLHEGEINTERLKEKYESACEKLENCKIIKEQLQKPVETKLTKNEEELISEYENSLNNLYVIDVVKQELDKIISNQKDKILEAQTEKKFFLQMLISEADENTVKKEDYEIPELIKQYVKITENQDSTITISFGNEETDNSILDDYLFNKSIVEYDFNGNEYFYSKAYADARDFLIGLEEKSYSIEDIILAICYLKMTENKSLYLKGEDPENSDNYPLNLGSPEAYGLVFENLYVEGRLEGIEDAYNKINDADGLDDIAKFIFYSNYNINPSFQLEQREIDVIAYRGLQHVIDRTMAKSDQFNIYGAACAASAVLLSALAAIPVIGAWAILPCSVMTIAASTNFFSANSLYEIAKDMKSIQKGYSEIVNEYDYKYNDITQKYILAVNKEKEETEKYNLICRETGDGEYDYDNFCNSLIEAFGSSDFITKLKDCDNKTVKQLLCQEDISDVITGVNCLYQKYLDDYNSASNKISKYIEGKRYEHNTKMVLLYELENSLLPGNETIDIDEEKISLIHDCYGQESWNESSFLYRLNKVSANVYKKNYEFIENQSDYYDFCFYNQSNFYNMQLNKKYESIVDENEFEISIACADFVQQIENWNEDNEISMELGEEQWIEAENRLYDEYDKWKSNWTLQYRNNLEELNSKYEEFQSTKTQWLENQYIKGFENSVELSYVDDFRNETINIEDKLNCDINSVFTANLNSEFERLDSFVQAFSINTDYGLNIIDTNKYAGLTDSSYLESISQQMELLNYELKKNSSVYAGIIAEYTIQQRINDIEATINNENEKMTKWQNDMVRKDGYTVGEEIFRDAVVDSYMFNNCVRKRQTVHKYEWFVMDNPGVNLYAGNLEYLDSDSVNLIIQNMFLELDELYKKIFGSDGNTGDFAEHLGEAPEFIDNVDVKKECFENISKNGSGEIGLIMLDYMWNSFENSEGYAQLTTPLYDKKLTSENKIFGIELPTLRTITDIVCSIVAKGTGQGWIEYVDEVLYGVFDLSYKRKDLGDFVAEGLKKAASSVISKGTEFLNGAVDKINISGLKTLTKGVVKAGTTYVSEITNNFVDSIDFKNGFKIDWENFTESCYSKETLNNALSGFCTEVTSIATNKFLNKNLLTDGLNQNLNAQVFDVAGIEFVNRTTATLASSGVEYLITGNTSLNLFSVNNLGFNLDGDVGLFEVNFDREGVSATIGKGGTQIDTVKLLKNSRALSDTFRIAGAKVGRGNKLAILNGVNAAANCGTATALVAANNVWRNEWKFEIQDMDKASCSSDGKITFSSDFIDTTKDAAAQFASLLAYEGAHLESADEFMAKMEQTVTFTNIRKVYEITEDLFSDKIDTYKHSEILESSGEKGLFIHLFNQGTFDKKTYEQMYEVKDSGIKQCSAENRFALGGSRSIEEVEAYNEGEIRKLYEQYIKDKLKQFMETDFNVKQYDPRQQYYGLDEEAAIKKFIRDNMTEYTCYEDFKNVIISDSKKSSGKILGNYSFTPEREITGLNSGCVLATTCFIVYSVTGKLYGLKEANDILVENDVYSGNDKNQINRGESYIKAVNTLAGEDVLESFEIAYDIKDMNKLLNQAEKSIDSYVGVLRVNNGGHSVVVDNNQNEKNYVLKNINQTTDNDDTKIMSEEKIKEYNSLDVINSSAGDKVYGATNYKLEDASYLAMYKLSDKYGKYNDFSSRYGEYRKTMEEKKARIVAGY